MGSSDCIWAFSGMVLRTPSSVISFKKGSLSMGCDSTTSNIQKYQEHHLVLV